MRNSWLRFFKCFPSLLFFINHHYSCKCTILLPFRKYKTAAGEQSIFSTYLGHETQNFGRAGFDFRFVGQSLALLIFGVKAAVVARSLINLQQAEPISLRGEG